MDTPDKGTRQTIRDLVFGVQQLFPFWPFFFRYEVRQTEGRIFDIRAAFRRWSRDALDPSDPPKPIPHFSSELGHLDDWRDGNKQREDLNNVSFLIDIPRLWEHTWPKLRENALSAVSKVLSSTTETQYPIGNATTDMN